MTETGVRNDIEKSVGITIEQKIRIKKRNTHNISLNRNTSQLRSISI